MRDIERGNDSPCPFEPAVDLISGRWASHVLWLLNNRGEMRFSELRSEIPEVTAKVLTERLRQLQRNGLVARTQLPEASPRVGYEITELGMTLVPLFHTLAAWSEQNYGDVLSAQRDYDTLNYGPANPAEVEREPVA